MKVRIRVVVEGELHTDDLRSLTDMALSITPETGGLTIQIGEAVEVRS